MTRAYYNEFDPYAAAWLRNLIGAGLIAPGDVDERSITDVRPSDLKGYTQAHFFAGIGGWSLAARLAGWPDDRPLWTGSCPCQPFSVAGAQKGQSDERHLWPVFAELIRTVRPSVVMGEQVAAAVGKDWLDGVCADLEGIGYACGAAVVPACAVDAPHRRDRLWFVADAAMRGREPFSNAGPADVQQEVAGEAKFWKLPSDNDPSALRDGALADAQRAGSLPAAHAGIHRGEEGARPRHVEPVGHRRAGDDAGALADPRLGRRGGPGRGQGELARGAEAVGPGDGAVEHAESGRGRAAGDMDRSERAAGGEPVQGSLGRASVGASAWSGAGWIFGADGKARRVEPGIRLLAHGVPARVGRLRAYGNAIVPQVAAEIIGAYLDAEADRAGPVRLEPGLFD